MAYKIRVFINTWTETQRDGGGLDINDPIDDYLNDLSLSGHFSSVNFYAAISLSNRPDKNYLFKVCRGDITDQEWSDIASIQGVLMLPPHDFDLPISEVKPNIRNQIRNNLSAFGAPLSLYDEAATIGGFLRSFCQHVDENFTSFGLWELAPAEWA